MEELGGAQSKEVGEKGGREGGVGGSGGTDTEGRDFYRNVKRGESATLALFMVDTDKTTREGLALAKKYLVNAVPKSIIDADMYLRQNNTLKAQLRDAQQEIDRLKNPTEDIDIDQSTPKSSLRM